MTKRALMVWGGWEGHEPRECVELFADVLRGEGFEVRVEDHLDVYLDEPYMRSLDLVVPIWTMGEISKEQARGLLAAVRGGVNVGGWHGGMCDAFRTNTEYHFMTGGQFVCHPGNIIDYAVDIADPDHPVTRGLGSFAMRSEQYYMHVDPSNHVLATTTFSGEHAGIDWVKGTVMPVAWTRPYGAARVFFTSLGHVRSDFDVPEARELTRRGLLWAAGALDEAPVA